MWTGEPFHQLFALQGCYRIDQVAQQWWSTFRTSPPASSLPQLQCQPRHSLKLLGNKINVYIYILLLGLKCIQLEPKTKWFPFRSRQKQYCQVSILLRSLWFWLVNGTETYSPLSPGDCEDLENLAYRKVRQIYLLHTSLRVVFSA